MARREKIALTVNVILILFVVLLLFLNAQPTQPQKAHRILVSISEDKKEYWDSFRYGLERASRDNAVDLIVINEETPSRAVEEIHAAIDEGISALVLAAPSRLSSSLKLDLGDHNFPVIAVGDCSNYLHSYTFIGASETLIGEEIGRQVVLSGMSDSGVIVFSAREQSERYIGLSNYLNAKKVKFISISSLSEIPSLSQSDSPNDQLLVGLDNSAVEKLCDLVGEQALEFPDSPRYRIIGADYCNRTLFALEEGDVLSLVIQNQYELGYRAVERAVAEIAGRKSGTELDLYVATRQNMRGELAPVLYPIF